MQTEPDKMTRLRYATLVTLRTRSHTGHSGHGRPVVRRAYDGRTTGPRASRSERDVLQHLGHQGRDR